MASSFDYDDLGKCQYQEYFKSQEVDCGEPAIAKGWWVDEKGNIQSEIYLCPKHLKFILEREKK